MTDAADFFRSRLGQMIDRRHPLATLASRMPWQELGASMASVLANSVRSGKEIESSVLFGPISGIANPGSSGGRRFFSMSRFATLFFEPPAIRPLVRLPKSENLPSTFRLQSQPTTTSAAFLFPSTSHLSKGACI